MKNNLELLKELATATHEKIYKYFSGFEELDSVVGGFRSKQLYVFSARGGVGKTSLLTSLFSKLAVEDVKSYVFSLELSWEEMCCRFARNILRDIQFQFDEAKAVETLLQKYEQDSENKVYYDAMKNIYISDSPVSIEEVGKIVEKCKNEQNIRVFGIDYTGLIYIPVAQNTPEWTRLGMILEQLKAIAKQHNVVLFLINHLNRSVATDNAMSEQGGTIHFERIASCILQIYDDEHNKSKRTIKITKNRMGEAITITLNFNGAYDAFF